MKKIISILAAILLLITAIFACQPKAEAQTTVGTAVQTAVRSEQKIGQGVVNPLTSYQSLDEMLASTPGILMADAPAGATDVSYDTITGGTVSPIAQILFTLNGDSYTYRAAACAEEAKMQDIAGVYEEFDKSEQLTSDANLTDGGTYRLEYTLGSTMGLATWYYGPAACQYSLFTKTGCGTDQKIEEVVDELLNIPGTITQTREIVQSAPKTDTVTGTVVAVGSNQIVINMSNGNTLTFFMSAIKTTAAQPGDEVEIAFSGSITDAPEAVSITVKSAARQIIAGDVVQYDTNGLYVKTTTGNIYGFVLGKSTTITGKAKAVGLDDTVQVTYSGSLLNMPTALTIEILQTAPAPKEEKKIPTDKTLDGWVTEIKTKTFTIVTNNGKYWTFKKDGTTVIDGGYTFQEWANVRVLYDGYASNHPVAREITVLAPPDPTPPDPPTPPVYHSVDGWITVKAGNALSIQTINGRNYDFLLASPHISGDPDSANYAYITYYDANGSSVVTDINYETRLLQEDQPESEPEQNPILMDAGQTAAQS
jgi:hypothetical protein